MAQYKGITLSNGMVIRVYRPPYIHIHANVAKRHPEPPSPPTITEQKVTGDEITMVFEDDPEYQAELARWNEVVNEETDMMCTVFALKDVQVPDDWTLDTEAGPEMRFFDHGWSPREGPIGRKLDYIQWVVLVEIEDLVLYSETLRDVSAIDLKEVAANEASFRDQVEEPTA